MKKSLLVGLNTLALLVLAQMIIGQVTMPPAISISPANGTAWDEITLTLDPTQACVPDGKGSVIGASVVKMHSAAYLYDYIDDWGTTWGQYGVDYDKEPKDGIHTAPDLLPNGDGTYSITFVPGDFYGVEEGSTIIGITAVFNSGSWDNECKDFGDDGCKDFYIPLNYVNPTPAFKFKLDLTYQETLGNFDKDGGKAYVIVDGTPYEMEQLLEGIFPVAKYEYLMTSGVVKDQTYTYKFKMNDTEETVDARSVVAIGSQKVLSHFFNDEEPITGVTVRFQVDMRYYMREMKFDASSQYVDVAGSMNGWDGTNHHLTDENADSVYLVDVPELVAGDTYQYKYRIDGSWDDAKSEFPAGGPNRRFTARSDGGQTKDVFNNYRPGWVPLTLAVNMARAVQIGQLVPSESFMDVAGSFNDWGGSNELFDDDADYIYVTAIPVIAQAGATAYYKFRIDASWDDSKHEFPSGGPAREYAVLDTLGGVENLMDTVWFNNIGLFIEPGSVTRLNEVMIYPNPATDVLYVENAFEIREVRISNILGQTIMNFPVDNKNYMEINTSSLAKGMYILSVYGDKGYKGTAKFIIK